jgi:hypothetical protein
MHISAQSPAMIVITTFAMFVIFMLWYETYKQRLDWRDLITNPATNHVSLTKVLQLVGGVVGTWVMVIVTLHDKLTGEIFFTYLAYVGAIEGWSKFITAKYGATGDMRPYNRPGMNRYGNSGGYGGYQPEYEQTGQPYPPPRNPSSPPAAKPPIGDDIE